MAMNHLMETKDPPSSKLRELYEYVDRNRANMTASLREAVAIPCLSKNNKYFSDITKMLKLCQKKMEDLGATTELVESGNVKTANGADYPPVLFGNLFIAEGLKTICVYGHVDTELANDEESPNNENFDLVVKNETMHGRGVSLGKGPLFCWLNALKTFVASNVEIPLNIKFIVEGTSAIFSPTLEDVISKKNDFFIDIDYTCLMIDKKIVEVPCLRYGYRGLCHFSLDINCGRTDIDSGDYGGAFDQPLMDAVRAVSSLMDKHDKLVLPNIVRDVANPSTEEKKIMEQCEPNIDEIKGKIGVKRLRHKGIPSRIVNHKTQLPSVTIHGFETSTNHLDDDNRAIIPCRTVVRFSITFANEQKASDARSEIENHVKNVWNRWKCVNEYDLRTDASIDAWKEDPMDLHYKAAAKAIKSVYRKEPLYVQDGSSAAAAAILKKASVQCSSLVISLGEPQEQTGDEFVSIESYLNGVKIIVAYMCYINEL